MKPSHDGQSEVWGPRWVAGWHLFGDKYFLGGFQITRCNELPSLLLSEANLGLAIRKKCSWHWWAMEMRRIYKGPLRLHEIGTSASGVYSRCFYWVQEWRQLLGVTLASYITAFHRCHGFWHSTCLRTFQHNFWSWKQIFTGLLVKWKENQTWPSGAEPIPRVPV